MVCLENVLRGMLCCNTVRDDILPLLDIYKSSYGEKGDKELEGDYVQLSRLRGERDSRDPQSLLDSLNFQLRDKFGKEVRVQVLPRTYERKKKKVENELKRLTSAINYGNPKKGKGKTVFL